VVKIQYISIWYNNNKTQPSCHNVETLHWAAQKPRNIIGPVQICSWVSPKNQIETLGQSRYIIGPVQKQCMLSPHCCVLPMLLVQPQCCWWTKYGPSCKLHIITMISFLFFVFVISIEFVLRENNGQKRLMEFLCILHFPSWQTCWANVKKHGESKIWSLFKDGANMKKHKLH